MNFKLVSVTLATALAFGALANFRKKKWQL
jgi:hypothetical protein